MYYKSDTNDYKDFLLKMDEHRSKTVYARITALNFNENPIESIEGRVTQGSLNIDGSSAVRRTCSLSIIAQNFDFNDYLWGLNTKFKLEIGLENFVDDTMPDIIWFNQGIFIISNFTVAHSVNNLSITIQGKDKMCLLNGEVGGALESSVDFGTIEEVDKSGDITYKKISLENIIRNMLHQYGREPYNNIVINDLDTLGLELLQYRYTTPMYLYRREDLGNGESPLYDNMVLESNNSKYYILDENGDKKTIELSELTEKNLDILTDPLIDEMNNPEPVYDENGNAFIFSKIKFGETAGYRTTKLVYAGDLIAAAGDTITSVLDKIKNMLGQFEYFYDIEGKFVFQKKRSYTNTLWTPINISENNKEYVENLYNSYPIAYTFNSSNLISAFQSNPNLLNVRNDYSIWGERKGVADNTIPIHLRYAIDKKPTFYRSYDGKRIYSIEKKEEWEIIEEISNEILEDLHAYKKTPNPNGLPEEWWAVHDWAEYYKVLTGQAPTGRISDYATEVTRINIHDYFPRTTKWMQKNNKRDAGAWRGTYAFLFDVYADDPEYGVESFEHNSTSSKLYKPSQSCGHDYTHFLSQYEKGIISFFYRPIIPTADIEEEIIKRIVTKIKNYNCDWREIIYQMAKDYLQYAIDENGTPNDEFLITVANNNPDLFPTGITGYEQYYTDLQGFWRQLYYPYIQQYLEVEFPKNTEIDTSTMLDVEIDIIKVKEVLIKTLQKEIENLQESIENLQKNIDAEKKKETPNQNSIKTWETSKNNKQIELSEKQYQLLEYQTKVKELESVKENYCFDKEDKFLYWNKAVYQNPETLNFWFDFLDEDGELNQFNVQSIGIRSKVVNDSNIKAIYFRETPDVIFMNPNDNVEGRLSGYKYIQVQNIESMFSISAQGKSAKTLLEELLYQHGYCVEGATITAVPIYYLEPNTRIFLSDKKTSIEGDYIINKITIPLNYGGMMTIAASKAAKSIL